MTRATTVRTLVPLLAAAVYVTCLAWQAPHTVHHFFESHAEKQNECALSAAAERSSGTAVEPVSLVPVVAVELPPAVAAQPLVPLLARALPATRAPPRSSA